MAFVVRRPGGRWEFRESYATDAGPRARTLASFKVLDGEVLDRAVRSSRGKADRDSLLRAARRMGVPIERSPLDQAAESVISAMARGERLRPGLRQLLITQLGPPNQRDDSFAEWIGASLEERGEALVQLLDLVDRIPHPPERQLRFPRFTPANETR